MNYQKEIKKFTQVFSDLLAERDEIRLALKEKKGSPAIESEIASVLRNALDNKKGWREEARRVLGLYELIDCENCGRPFPSGGHRRKTCSESCRVEFSKPKRNIT